MLLPSELHQRNIEVGKCIYDPFQEQALAALDAFSVADKKAMGLYLWGRVGRGKTYLMDCLWQTLDSTTVKRQHYYRFMKYVHAQLVVHQGSADPLSLVAKDIAVECRVLCLDEFFVSDIADAMILYRLLSALFDCQVSLVTTSNVAPVDLYKDGLQRDRFLPAIAMLQERLQVLCFSGEIDHRLAKATDFDHLIVSSDNRELIIERFLMCCQAQEVCWEGAITLQRREVGCIGFYEGYFVFDFAQLFEGPRSTLDYIELAERASAVFICHIPPMGGEVNERKVARGTEDTYNINQKVADRPFVAARSDDSARRFIGFIDEAYDRLLPVVLGSEVSLVEFYSGGTVVFEFERALSRIIEMQSWAV